MRTSFLIILLLSALAYLALLSSAPIPDWLAENFPQVTQAVVEGRRELDQSWRELLEVIDSQTIIADKEKRRGN